MGFTNHLPTVEQFIRGVTLLVCTHNGASRLPELFRYIAAQRVSSEVSWEVLLVDNASTDDTLAVAAKAGQQLLPAHIVFRTIKEPRAGKENALVRGLNEATYEAVAIVDDDNLLAPDYTQVAFEIMRAHPQIGILGAYAEGAFEVAPPAWFTQVQAIYAIGEQNEGVSGPYPARQGFVYGAGSVVRRSAWLRLSQHGFRFLTQVKRGTTLAGGEDIELGEALRLAGYELWYDKRLRFRHFMYRNRLTWDYLLRIGPGSPSALLISNVYFFIARYPSISSSKFKKLYAKQVLWMLKQVLSNVKDVARTLRQNPLEGDVAGFRALRQIHALRIAWTNRREALRIFKEVKALALRLRVE